MENINTLTKYRYSVIVPVYNSQKTIAMCMKSALSAMRNDVELILIDNGSTDDSSRIIQEVTGSCEWLSDISYHYESNSGVSSARNFGIDAAKGEYLIFLDSDDELTSDFFDVLDRAEDADLVIYQMEDEKKKKPFPVFDNNLSYEDRFVSLLHEGFIHSSSNKRFKKALIDQSHLRFNEKLNIGEDFLFSMSYSIHCKDIQLINEYLYIVNYDNPNSLSRGYRPNLTQQLVRLYKLQEKNLLNCSLTEACKKQLLREMDYLHSKAICSCIAETFKVNFGPYLIRRKQFQKIGKAFDAPLTDAEGYCNQVHKILNWLLAHHIIYPIYIITAFMKARSYSIYRQAESKET